MKNFRIVTIVLFSSILLFAISCGEKSIEKSENAQSVSLDSAKSSIVNVSGELFSIPSPIQTAMLIQKSEVDYRPELLSEANKYSQFESNALKAMNLGVFGTDMAYSSLYQDGQKALSYFKALDNLAKDLGVSSAVSPELVKRLGANADNPDSLVYLTGRFYEEGDAYLKKNKRYDIASMIILGGWIESSYLTAQSALDGNQAATTRLLNQKKSSSTMLKALGKTTDTKFQKSELYQVLDSLEKAFVNVESSYTYNTPETDASKKVTVIRSETEYHATDSLIHSIAALIESARTKITEK